MLLDLRGLEKEKHDFDYSNGFSL